MSEMKMTPEEGQEFERTLPVEGLDQGVLYSILDLGTQTSKYGDKRKLELSFELPNQKHEFKEGEGEKPLIVSEMYTMSFNTRSNLFKDISTILGSTPGKDFDLFSLIGKTCNLNIGHNTRGKETFAVVKNIFKMGPDSPQLTGEMPTKTLSLDPKEFDIEVFKSLPTWKQDLIGKSPEFQKAWAIANS